MLQSGVKIINLLAEFCWQWEKREVVSSQLQDATHNQPHTTMNITFQKIVKTAKLELREIEIPTADLWLSTGAVTITETGDENTYYSNEFGHLFFCKNYPANQQTKPQT